MPPETWTIEAQHLERAQAIVREHAVSTPLIRAPALGPEIYLKLETAQHTGSFKFRGALSALAGLGEAERSRGVITATAGNHGYGLARAGRILGVSTTVCVAESTPAVKRDGIANAGATLELVPASGYDEVEAFAKAAAVERGLLFVSPFDDPYVAAGNGGTVALEILEQRPAPGTVIAPVGGGGLIAGIAAARRIAGAEFRIVGVQSEACPSMVESIRQGRAQLRFEGGATLAEGLEGGVSETTFAVARDELESMEAVSEASIADAMVFAKRELGVVVEGSAAVGLAYVRERSELGPAVVVISGGNVDPARLVKLEAG